MESKNNKPRKAVALAYAHEMSAPEVVATGVGTTADKIIELAEANAIPVREDPVLVDALRQLDIGQEIPPELYQVVAEVLVFIMNMDKKAK